MVRVVSLSVLLTLIVILGLTFYKVLAPFLLPLFLAAVFAILCQPIQDYFVARTRGRLRLASGLTTASIVSMLLVPLVVGTVLASLQLFVVATNLSDRNLTRAWQQISDPVLQRVADFVNARVQQPSSAAEVPDVEDDTDELPVDAPSAESPETKGTDSESIADRFDEQPSDAQDPALSGEHAADSDLAGVSASHAPVTAESLRKQLEDWARRWLAEIGRKSLGMAGGTLDLLSGSLVAVGSAALSFVIFVIALYYFLADGSDLVRATERLIPVHVEYQRQMLGQFSRVVRAVVMATFLAALAQSVATIVALWMFGFDHLFVLFVVALLTSMIPMLGTWLVWLPCAAYLAWQGDWLQALVLSVYGTAFVGMLDNLVRTYVLNTDIKLHPLLALISVLGGLQVLGLWGVFVGPIVASCLHALVRIFNHELAALSKEKFAGREPTAAEIPALAAADDAPQPQTAS